MTVLLGQGTAAGAGSKPIQLKKSICLLPVQDLRTPMVLVMS